MKVEISRSVLDAILAHAASDPGREACGLLFGTEDRVDGVMAARNVADDRARHFEINPVTLFAAVKAERAGGARLAGYYHSHPNGRAEPSATDRRMAAADGKLWVIVASGAAKAWRATGAGFAPVEMLVG